MACLPHDGPLPLLLAAPTGSRAARPLTPSRNLAINDLKSTVNSKKAEFGITREGKSVSLNQSLNNLGLGLVEQSVPSSKRNTSLSVADALHLRHGGP